MTIELCDGTPAMIDDDLETWLTSVGSFCPWSAQVIAVEPLEPVIDPTAPPVEPDPSAPPTDDSPCAGDPGSDEAVIVTFETGDPGDGDTFQAVLTDPQSIARARSEAELGVDCGFPNGLLIAAQGATNTPHAWELRDAVYADMTIEACSARASEVDANLDYWLSYGRYCPWSAQAIAVEPLAAPPPVPTATIPAPAPTDVPVLTPSEVAAPAQPTALTQPPMPGVTPEQPSGSVPDSSSDTAPRATAQPVAALPNTGSGGAIVRFTGNGWWVIGSIAVGVCVLLLSGRRIRSGSSAHVRRWSP